MKLLFFDMEFADGRVPGSIYSFGYLMTDENFEVLRPQTDLLINPDSTWNDYVVENILAYPKEEVEAAPNFPAHYDALAALFSEADLAVGFAVNNDTRALKKDCERYGLEPLRFRTLDMEKLCRRLEEHRDARGLGGCVAAWCGEEPDNRHRSDGDAYATMLLLSAVCRAKHATPDMIAQAYPECCGVSSAPQKGKKTVRAKRHRRGTHPKREKVTALETDSSFAKS
ncbi:MAG: 3'-5' exonuclease [Clostridia bacterium]|nr:3'-5' exonuclease [Clostridia bacterium]